MANKNVPKQNEPLKLIVIKTKDKAFISDNLKNDRWYNSYLASYFYDGEKPENSFVSNWYILKDIPKKVTEIIPAQRINIHYELKRGFLSQKKRQR